MNKIVLDLRKAQEDFAVQNRTIALMAERIDQLEKVIKQMTDDTTKFETSLSALEQKEADRDANELRLLKDYQAANAALAAGQQLSQATLDAFQARIDVLSGKMDTANAAINQADPPPAATDPVASAPEADPTSAAVQPQAGS